MKDFASRYVGIDRSVQGIQDALRVLSDPNATEAQKNALMGSTCAHAVNIVGYALLALTEIAEAQQAKLSEAADTPPKRNYMGMPS